MPELVGRVMECWSGLSCNTDIGVSVLKVVNAYLGADADKKRPISSISLARAAVVMDCGRVHFRRQILTMAEAVFAGSLAFGYVRPVQAPYAAQASAHLHFGCLHKHCIR